MILSSCGWCSSFAVPSSSELKGTQGRIYLMNFASGNGGLHTDFKCDAVHSFIDGSYLTREMI